MAEQVRIPGLDEIRRQIDEVDTRLLELLNRRAQLSLAAGELKAACPGARVFDPARETALLDSLSARNPGPLTTGHIVSIWRSILSASRAVQKPCTVAYLGPEGTFSYFAANDYLGSSMRFVPCGSFLEIYRKVYSGECDMGAVPLENSIHGTITQSFDLFSQYDVRIQAEFYSRIANSILSRESSLDDIDVVYSHAQPLGQCASWLHSHLPNARLVSVESTAAAAWKASEEPRAASIGHRSMAEKLGMSVLAGNIEDDSANWTRFVLISGADMSELRRPQTAAGDFKSSLIFTLSDKVGALSGVLSIFTAHGINMSKLESRPQRGTCWKYIFFADVECNLSDPAYAGLLSEMNALCTMVRVLGCYPEGPMLDSTSTITDTAS